MKKKFITGLLALNILLITACGKEDSSAWLEEQAVSNEASAQAGWTVNEYTQEADPNAIRQSQNTASSVHQEVEPAVTTKEEKPKMVEESTAPAEDTEDLKTSVEDDTESDTSTVELSEQDAEALAEAVKLTVNLLPIDGAAKDKINEDVKDADPEELKFVGDALQNMAGLAINGMSVSDTDYIDTLIEKGAAAHEGQMKMNEETMELVITIDGIKGDTSEDDEPVWFKFSGSTDPDALGMYMDVGNKVHMEDGRIMVMGVCVGEDELDDMSKGFSFKAITWEDYLTYK